MEFGTLFTKTLAIFTLLGNTFFIGTLILHVVAKPFFRRIMRFLGHHALWIGFFIASAATLGSLLYSEVVGYPACILCWTQRIFMYPLPFLFGLALWRKEKLIIPYTLLLALMGGAVALYQWVKDMLATYSSVTIPCPAVSALPSCDRIYVLEFHYITIPMIALNAFVLLILICYAQIRSKKFSV